MSGERRSVAGGLRHRRSLSSLEFCAAAAAMLVRSLCTRAGGRGGIKERQKCLQQHLAKRWRQRRRPHTM